MFTARQLVSITARRVPAVLRTRVALASRFSTSIRLASDDHHHNVPEPAEPKVSLKLEDVKSTADLYGPGAEPGTIPTDFEQSTGLERIELLGNLAGIDVFGEQLLDSSRIGTVADPIIVDSPVSLRYLGCSGSPADSHEVIWLAAEVGHLARCIECGSVYKLNYLGAPEEEHGDHSHAHAHQA
ncbi:cytochrome c oxidase subunit VB-domain-containing protein [Lipomyces japonicus]|uniref:cytochrome c oxidase subunit VB-domain-containing protein n=1 Tax=Lipomyces japonicus TaxID=56871 RepID=UPI0034CF87F2